MCAYKAAGNAEVEVAVDESAVEKSIPLCARGVPLI